MLIKELLRKQRQFLLQLMESHKSIAGKDEKKIIIIKN